MTSHAQPEAPDRSSGPPGERPPDDLLAWASDLLGPLHDFLLVSTSNSRVWSVHAADGRAYALKHLVDTSGTAAAEYAVRRQLADCPLLQPLTAVRIDEAGSAFALSEFVTGRTLDEAFPTAGGRAEVWAGQLAGLLDRIARVPVTGFGKLTSGLAGDHTSWSDFLHGYLDEQRRKAPGLAAARHTQLRDLLDEVTSELDRAAPAPGLVAADINNRNFVVDARGITCVNLPVLWGGDPMAMYGQALLHWEGTHGIPVLRARSAVPAWRLHFYAAYHAYVILAYVERFSPVPFGEAAPWGRTTPLLHLFDEHLALAAMARAGRPARTGPHEPERGTS